MPFHWHMECELILVLAGKFRLSVNGVNYTLEGGQSAFIPSEFIHGGTPENCIYECVVFDMESFLAQSPQCIEKYNNAIDSGVISEMIFEPKSTAGKMVDSLFENMEKESVAYTFATTGLLWQLIGYILEQKSQIAPSSQNAVYRKNKQIKKVLTKIRNDYSKPLTLDDFAAGLNNSKKALDGGRYGLFGALKNAVIMNVEFVDLIHTGNEFANIFAYQAVNSTMKNVIINVKSSSIGTQDKSKSGFLFGYLADSCKLRDITVNASGQEIFNLVGVYTKRSGNPTTADGNYVDCDNVVVNAKKLYYWCGTWTLVTGADSYWIPTSMTLNGYRR